MLMESWVWGRYDSSIVRSVGRLLNTKVEMNSNEIIFPIARIVVLSKGV